MPDGPAFSLKLKTKEITEAAIRTTRIVTLGYDIGVQQPLSSDGPGENASDGEEQERRAGRTHHSAQSFFICSDSVIVKTDHKEEVSNTIVLRRDRRGQKHAAENDKNPLGDAEL